MVVLGIGIAQSAISAPRHFANEASLHDNLDLAVEMPSSPVIHTARRNYDETRRDYEDALHAMPPGRAGPDATSSRTSFDNWLGDRLWTRFRLVRDTGSGGRATLRSRY